jgi:hypothetical protein
LFLCRSVFMLIMGALDCLLVIKPDLVTMRPFIPGFLIGFAHIFTALGNSFYVRIPFRVWFPEKISTGFWLSLITGLIVVVIGFAQPIFPTVEAGISNYNIGPLFRAATSIYALVFIFGFGVVFFLYQSFKAKTRFVRIRSMIFGIGFLIGIIGGPLHDFATTTAVYLLADILLILSQAIILLGIFTKKFVSPET